MRSFHPTWNGIARLFMRHLLQHRWHGAFDCLAEFEERTSARVDRSDLMQVMRNFGLPAGFTTIDFDQMERAWSASRKMNIDAQRLDGIEPWFVLQLWKWFRDGLITSRDANLLCFYRQRFFFGGNLSGKDVDKRSASARGSGMFAPRNDEDRDRLIKAARQCEKFLSLL